MIQANTWSAHELGDGTLLKHPLVDSTRVGKHVHILRRLDGWQPGQMPYFEVRVTGEEPQPGSVYPAYPGDAIGQYVPPPPAFTPFPKIARLNREWVVTEKIDGTNACVHVADDGTVRAGSRTRWITTKDDNFGFARWVSEHEDELRVGLGIGLHYGEWFGAGIQRGYGLKEKRFALFNVALWIDDAVRPKCCHVVPILTRGLGVDHLVAVAIRDLNECGSAMVPGFMKPEGVVIFHTASRELFKVTCEKDESPKGQPQ